MFSIVIAGQQVDHSGITVNLYLKSTFPFSPDQGQIEGSFAFNGSLPASPLNKRIFGFPHRLEGVFDLPSNIPCQLMINSRLWYDALISITSSTETIFNFDLLFGYGGFASLIEGKTLKDLTFPDPVPTGQDQQAVIAFAEDVITKAYPETLFNFPMIYNPDFYGDDNPDFLWFMNHYNSGAFVENIYSSIGVRNFNTLVPMLYLQYVTKLCFETFGYTPFGSFFDDPELAKALLFNNCALDQMRKRYLTIASQTDPQTASEMEIIEFDDDSTGDNEDLDDCFDVASHQYEVKTEGLYYISIGGEFNSASESLVAFVLRVMKDGQEILRDQLGWRIYTDWYRDSVFFEIYLEAADIGSVLTFEIGCFWQNFYPTDGQIRNANLVVENTSFSNLNVYAQSIDFINHVPEKEISAFLVNLQLLFGIIIGFDHDKKTAEVSFIRDSINFPDGDDLTEFTKFSSKKVVLEPSEGYNIQFDFDTSDRACESIKESVDLSQFIGEFAKFTDLPWPSTINDVAYVRNTNSYYTFIVLDGPGPYWYLLAHYHPVISVGMAKNEVRPEMSPLMTHLLVGNKCVYATILQPGTSFAYADKINDPGLRFLFYHGLCPMVGSKNTYPFGSALSYDSLGNSVGSTDLVLHGSKGIYETFLENYYSWLNNIIKKVTFSTRMTFSKLKLLDLRKIYRIFSSRFLIYEAKVSVTEDTMADVELDCRKV